MSTTKELTFIEVLGWLAFIFLFIFAGHSLMTYLGVPR